MGAARATTRLQAWQDRVRGSLFVVPMLFVVGGAVLAELMLAVDGTTQLVPQRLTATIDSARAVLTVVASATLAFAGVAFSVALLLISQASSHYSPRVVHGLFRDPFTRRVLGIVIGTFTYCLVVLRAVRGPLDGSGDGVVPSVSVVLAVVLGVVAVLSTVAFISHSAHSLDVSQVLHRVTAEALQSLPPESGDTDEPDELVPHGVMHELPFTRHGWVEQVDVDGLLDDLPEGTTVELLTRPGSYALPGTPMARVWTAADRIPHDGAPQRVADAVGRAIAIGPARTLLDDPSYGIRQLADVALSALSPGTLDPTTAKDALLHLATVLRSVLLTERRSTAVRRDMRVVLLEPMPSSAELVDAAFDEVRVAAIGQPGVLIALLDVLHDLGDALPEPHDAEARAALRRQAELVLECAQLGDLPAADRDRVRSAYRSRFAVGVATQGTRPTTAHAGRRTSG